MKPLGLVFAFGWVLSTGTVVTFDTGQVGRAPSGWTVAMTNQGSPPQWQILKDRTAPTQPYVLAQTSADGADRYPLAILDSVKVKDGDVSVRIKPVSGKEDRAGGVVWRYRDAQNYYLARINALKHDVAVYKVQNGVRIPVLPAAAHEIPANAWSTLKVSVRGDRFQVYLDHRRILQGADRTFGGPGKVGVWTEADSITYFDDFRVYPK
ncbi:MAG TPA: hypothetical protein VML19_26675 [Verrucomicrobiae bacterium]|nr:hypothetical protein [Verrucomicrobiae bacterium]